MVLGARVVTEARYQGPKDTARQGEGDEEPVLNPVHRGIAGFAGVPVCGDAGQMEQMLAGELGEVVEGPIERALNPAADYREGAEESSVPEEEDKAKEVEEGDAKAETDSRTPGGRRSGAVCGRGKRRIRPSRGIVADSRISFGDQLSRLTASPGSIAYSSAGRSPR